MVPVKAVIAEDDPQMRVVLRKLIEKVEGVKVVAEVEDGRTLLQNVEEYSPDVIFLDVDMPEVDGLDASRQIAELNPKIFIVFATAYPQYTQQAFEVYAFDYLVKPFKPSRIEKTMVRIQELITEHRRASVIPGRQVEPNYAARKLVVQYKRHKIFVNLSEIVLITRDNRKTFIYTPEKVYRASDSLGELENKLEGSTFFRCHQSFIVNLDMVTELIPWGQKSYLVKLAHINEDAIATQEKAKLIEKIISKS